MTQTQKYQYQLKNNISLGKEAIASLERGMQRDSLIQFVRRCEEMLSFDVITEEDMQTLDAHY